MAFTMDKAFIQKPCLDYFLGLAISIAYVPGVFAAAVPTGWFVLLLTIPLLFCLGNFRFTLNNIIILLIVGVGALSLTWTENLNIGMFIFLQLLVLGLTFYYGQNLTEESIISIFKGLATGLGISSTLAILQYFFNFQYVFTLNGNSTAGLFINPNILCEVSAIVLLGLIALKLYWWIPVTLPGLFLIHSRNAFLCLAIGLGVWGWKRNKTYTICAFLICTGVAYFYYKNSNMGSIQERLDMWADTSQGFKLFGNGIGSFEILYPLNATYIDTSVARPKFAHNDFLQLVFEIGIFAVLNVILILNILRKNSNEAIILYGLGIMALFSFPFNVPMLAFVGYLIAGYVSRNDWTICDFWYNRRLYLPKSYSA